MEGEGGGGGWKKRVEGEDGGRGWRGKMGGEGGGGRWGGRGEGEGGRGEGGRGEGEEGGEGGGGGGERDGERSRSGELRGRAHEMVFFSVVFASGRARLRIFKSAFVRARIRECK